MFKLILVIILIVLIMFLIKNKVIIKIETFFKKGFKKYNDDFGIYCYWNKQGSSKTLNCVKFLLENKDKRIYANIKSLKGVHYKYYSGFNTLLEIGTTESDCIIFYDELFKGLYKGKKMKNSEKEKLMDFMSQMRKRHIILITTAQEWLEVPIEFRRYVRYDIKCKNISFFGRPILIKEFNDTTQIKWDNNENEYISPRIKTIVEKGLNKVVNSYDTYETISNDELSPIDMYNDFTDEYKLEELKDYIENTSDIPSEEDGIVADLDSDFWSDLSIDDLGVDND